MSTVVMTNPKLPGEERAVTTPEALEEVWAPLGWVLVADEPADEAPKSPKPAQAPLTATPKASV